MSTRTATAIAAALLLFGCAETAPRPSATAPAGGVTPVAAVAPAAAAPGAARFDGRYRGESNLTLSRGNACGAQSGPRTVTVQNGQARMLYDTMRNLTATGQVRPDGSVTMMDESVINLRITGRFEAGRFQGEMNSGQCVRALDLRRVARPAA